MSKSIQADKAAATETVSRPENSSAQVLSADMSEQQLAVILSGLANAKGGTILIGTDEAPDAATAQQKLAQACLSCEPPLRLPPTQLVDLVSGQALSVSVPAGLTDAYSIGGRYWIRQGSRNRTLSGRPLQQLILERGQAFSAFESLPVLDATLDDVNWDKVCDYLKTTQMRLADAAEDFSEETVQALMRVGALVYKDDRYRPTYAGLVVFGRTPQQFLPSSEVVLVRYAGLQMSEEFLRESLRGSLPDQIRRAELFLLSNMRRGGRLVGWKRDDQTEYPLDAVREAVINAVAHRDYSIQGEGIRVIMFADRLEVYSPGRLPGHVTLENLVDERFSRNPVIVQLLVDLGFIESLGYGIDRMIALMQEANLPPPVFQETANGFKVTLYGHGEQLVSDGADPSRWVHLNLNERQVRALTYLTENDRITNRVYQELCPDVSPETIRRDLAELVSRGLLLKIGDKKATYYIFK